MKRKQNEVSNNSNSSNSSNYSCDTPLKFTQKQNARKQNPNMNHQPNQTPLTPGINFANPYQNPYMFSTPYGAQPTFLNPPPAHSSQNPFSSPIPDGNIFSSLLISINSIDQRLERLEKMDDKISKLEQFCDSMKDLNTRVTDVESNVKDVENACSVNQAKIDELFEEKDNLWLAISANGAKGVGKGGKISLEMVKIREDNDKLRSTVAELQSQSLQNNLVFYGIYDKPGENTEQLVKSFIFDMLNVNRSIDLSTAYRMNTQRKPRPIVVKFERYKDKEHIRSVAKRLKGTPFGISEHFSREVLKERKRLLPIYQEAVRQEVRAVLYRDKLYIENEPFDPTIHERFIKQNSEASSGFSAETRKVREDTNQTQKPPVAHSETEQTNVKTVS